MMGPLLTAVVVPLLASFCITVLVGLAALLAVGGMGGRKGAVLDTTSGTRTAFLLVTAALLVVFLMANQALLRGLAVGIWDAQGQFLPYFTLVADHVRRGELVTWDPWTNGGVPAMGDPQVGALSPIVNLTGLLAPTPSTGFRVYWLFMWWLGGAGMVALARHLGAPPWGAFVVALGFLFCGVYTGNAQHTTWIAAFSFLPLVIWRLDVALATDSFWPAAQAGALWGLSALAGHPGVVILVGGFGLLWAAGRVMVQDGPGAGEGPARPLQRTSPGHGLVAAGTLVGTGLLVLSPTYLSFFLDGAGVNPRTGTLPRDIALGNELHPGALATFASPYLTVLKLARPDQLWPSSDVSMVNIYLGVAVPVLALAALTYRGRNGWRVWLAVITVLSFACAMGETLPLRGWLYDWVPPTRFFRHSAVFRLPGMFGLAVLAALGAAHLDRELRASPQSAVKRLLVCAAIVCALALACFLPLSRLEWVRPVSSSTFQAVFTAGGWLQFVAGWGGLLIVAMRAWRVRDRLSVPVLAVALCLLASVDALLTGVMSMPTSMRIDPALWTELDARHRSDIDLGADGVRREASACPAQEPEERCRSNDQLVTKVPVLDAYATEKNPRQIATMRDPLLRASAIGEQRFWFSPVAAPLGESDEDFARFEARTRQLGGVPVVVHAVHGHDQQGPNDLVRLAAESQPQPGLADLDDVAAAVPVEPRVVSYTPRALELRLDVARRGWLLVTDRWAPGWTVTMDGAPAPMAKANFIFRAVAMEPGSHLVAFRYTPALFPWTILLSWLVLAGIALQAIGSFLLRLRSAGTLRSA